MKRMERCPACRARLDNTDICTRCGTNFSISRRAERQAQTLACVAVRELFCGHLQQAASTADAASFLANPLLAHAISQMIRIRERSSGEVVTQVPNGADLMPDDFMI